MEPVSASEPAAEYPRTQMQEEGLTIRFFDPVKEWERIKNTIDREIDTRDKGENWFSKLRAKVMNTKPSKTVKRGEGDNWKRRLERQQQLIDELVLTLDPTNARKTKEEVYRRLKAAERAEGVLSDIQDLNSELNDRFDISKVIDKKTLAELISIREYSFYEISNWKNETDRKWAPIRTEDAVCVTSGLQALANKEGVSLGRKAVDLGGGEGSWVFVLAKLGFDVTSIERDSRLIKQFRLNQRKLRELGIKTDGIQTINGEFSTDDSKNTPPIRKALHEADVMFSYVWPDEVPDRMKLFSFYGKENALLVMYSGGEHSFSINRKDIAQNGLEVVGKELKERLAGSKTGECYGYESYSFGTNWVVLRRSQTVNK